jgi:predicted ribosomally synthesized peptide with nif11-like leader
VGGYDSGISFIAMTQGQLKSFLEAVKGDLTLQEKLKAAAGDPEAVVSIAATAGFVFSVQELKKDQSQISEEELEGVVGGNGFTNLIVCDNWTIEWCG